MTYNSSKTGAQVDAAITDVQAAKAAGTTDTTAGRLLKVGDFGAGAAAGTTLLGTSNTPITPNATNLILESGAKLGVGTTTPNVNVSIGPNSSNPDGSVGVGFYDSVNDAANSGIFPIRGGNRFFAGVGLKSSGITSATFETTNTRNAGIYCAATGNTSEDGIRFLVSGSDKTVGAEEAGEERLRIASNGTFTVGAPGDEKMRVTADGNLLVGTTSQTGALERFRVVKSASGNVVASFDNQNANPQGILLTYSSAAPNNSGNSFITGVDSEGEEFRITSAGAFVQASDRRIKTNIKDSAEDSSGIIDAIRVHEYDKGKANPEHWSHGFIAQELFDVYPEAVNKPDAPDDMWGVDYSRLVPLMLKEIQSLRARVAELENKQ